MIIERYFLSILHKNLCCGCSWTAMSTHNIGFYGEISKIIIKYHKLCILSVLLISFKRNFKCIDFCIYMCLNSCLFLKKNVDKLVESLKKNQSSFSNCCLYSFVCPKVKYFHLTWRFGAKMSVLCESSDWFRNAVVKGLSQNGTAKKLNCKSEVDYLSLFCWTNVTLVAIKSVL